MFTVIKEIWFLYHGFPASDLSSHLKAELIFSVDIPPDQVTRQKYCEMKEENYLNLQYIKT